MPLKDPAARRAYHTEYMRRRYAKRPDVRQKQVARAALGKAIHRGLIERKPCNRCGETENVEAHHSDYSKPLDVEFLCVSCHKREHYSAGDPAIN